MSEEKNVVDGGASHNGGIWRAVKRGEATTFQVIDESDDAWREPTPCDYEGIALDLFIRSRDGQCKRSRALGAEHERIRIASALRLAHDDARSVLSRSMMSDERYEIVGWCRALSAMAERIERGELTLALPREPGEEG